MKKLILLLLAPFIWLMCESFRKRHTARHLYWTDFSGFEKLNPISTTFAGVTAAVSYVFLLMLIDYISGVL
jgi:hypothetical protein